MVYIAQQSFGFGEINPNLRNQYTTQPYRLGCMSLENALLSENTHGHTSTQYAID